MLRALSSIVVFACIALSVGAAVAAGGARRKIGDGQWVNQVWDVVEEPLATRSVGVKARFAATLPNARLVASKRWLVMVSDRLVMVEGPRTPLRPLGEHVPLPIEIDFFTTAAFATDAWLVLGAGSFSPSRLELLAINLDTGRLVRVPQVTARSWPPAAAPLFSGGLSERIIPLQPLSIVMLDTGMLVGSLGGVLRVEPKIHAKFYEPRGLVGHLLRHSEKTTKHVAILQLEDGLMFTVDNEDESHIERVRGEEVTTFDLGSPTERLGTRSLLKFEGRLFASSSAGLVELDEANKRYVHYPTTTDKAKRRVGELEVIGASLYGAREDGLVRFELDKKKATRFALRGCGGEVHDVLRHAGTWYVSSREQVCKVSGID